VSNGVFLKSTQVFSDLHTALKTYDGHVASAIENVDREIAETRAWLTERRTHWLREVEAAQQELQSAESALAACEACGYYDDEGNYCEPDCSSEQTEVVAATERAHSAQAGLAKVETWVSNCEYAIGEFTGQRQRFTSVVLDRIPKACSFLERKVGEYSEAIRVAVPRVSLSTVNAVGSGGLNSARTVTGSDPLVPVPGERPEAASPPRQKPDGTVPEAEKPAEIQNQPSSATHFEGEDATRLAQVEAIAKIRDVFDKCGIIKGGNITAENVRALRSALIKPGAAPADQFLNGRCYLSPNSTLTEGFLRGVLGEVCSMFPKELAERLPAITMSVVNIPPREDGRKLDGTYKNCVLRIADDVKESDAHKVCLHELGHWLRDHGPDWYRDAIKDHFNERTKGEEIVELFGYSVPGKVDDWFDLQAGRIYPDEINDPEGREVASVHLETLALPDDVLANHLSDDAFRETMEVTLSPSA